MRETVFKPFHVECGASMVEFAGWNMPVQYTSIVTEHKAVRSTGGVFDVSHMGRILITGKDHAKFTDHIATNGRYSMKPGQVRYNLICNERGMILDDVLISAGLGDAPVAPADAQTDPTAACRGAATFIVCNAGNHAKISAWLGQHAPRFDVKVTDITERYPMLALQGKISQALLQPLTDTDLSKIKYYRFNVGTVLGVPDVMISRTGYTGEDGFELIFPVAHAAKFWNGLLESGRPHGLVPAGLGARDTLRLEAGMPLYGHEIDDTVNPLEAGLDWAVDLTKDFIGSAALKSVQSTGITRRLRGLDVEGKRIARQGAPVSVGGKPAASVLSGTKSPTLDKVIATALLPVGASAPGNIVQVEIKEGLLSPAKVVELPFYKRAK